MAENIFSPRSWRMIWAPLEDPEDPPELSLGDVIERMYNLQVQGLDVAATNIKQAQKIQARAYNAKQNRNAFKIGEKIFRINPLWSTKLKALRKEPKWVGPYEIVQRKFGAMATMSLSGKNKGKVNTSSYPLNQEP